MAEIYDQVYLYTKAQILKITNSQNSGAQKAALANLRKGAGQVPGDLPQLWGTFLQDMPEIFFSFDGEPSRAEWAVYIALTLFAIHQQGHDLSNDPMYRSGSSLGSALAKLVRSEEDKERILRRFNAMATSRDIEELSHHLRTLIQILRSEDIPLDYPALAKDLYFYQNPESVSSVRLRWGQDFYKEYNTKFNSNNGEE